ncbi:MAG: Na/Pi symporter, partial [Gammaproteobacteria bacterium]|nr:Na/Pi symporter [Gammaproteobacteria bacterium]
MAGNILLGLGGIGLFLMGMIILTSGLRELPGGLLRRLLVRFTKTPLRGAIAGAATTAIVQSSSATTITAVGFVGAGLLTFPQGLGIVFGANIGTTITGWLVAIIGFKLKIGQIALLLVLAGALLRLFGRGRLQHVGWALAGFGMLFVGIDAMQQGLAQFQGVVTPEDFPEDTILGRLQLVAIGIAITLVTQSSSAGVAAALVALGTGTISFPQAAAMVIGMDVATTFKAALATIGGSVPTRQTGYAHVIYNVMTGVLAFFLLGPYVALVEPWIAQGGAGDAQISLVAFHTTFNTIGVILVLPFAQPFARLIEHLVPEHGPPLLRRLDERLLGDGAAAVDTAAKTVRDAAELLMGMLTELLDPGERAQFDPTRLTAVNEALAATRGFMERIRTEPANQPLHQRHLATMHALDHLVRLSHRCAQKARIEVLHTEPRLRRLSAVLRGAAAATLDDGGLLAGEERFDRVRRLLRRQRRLYRERTVEAAAQQRIDAYTTLLRLDGVRWLHRVAYHLWR